MIIMGFIVKNTTKCGLLDLVCPHSCRGCGQLGEVLCECCKKDILKHYEWICPICKKSVAKNLENVGEDVSDVRSAQKSLNILNKQEQEATAKKSHWDSAGDGFSKCTDCEALFDGLWAVGWREGVLEKLVEEYKYQSVWAMGEVLAELLDEVLPKGLEVVVVPLPTIGKHVRERGLDHTWRVARKLAKKRGWQCERLLARAVDTVQVGASVAERKAQAEKAYVVEGEVESGIDYLLLDDVWTTGATMQAAVKALREAGAERVCGAVVAVSR